MPPAPLRPPEPESLQMSTILTQGAEKRGIGFEPCVGLDDPRPELRRRWGRTGRYQNIDGVVSKSLIRLLKTKTKHDIS